MKKTTPKIKKLQGIKVDPSLDKYSDFPSEKLEQANKTLKAVGLPKLTKTK